LTDDTLVPNDIHSFRIFYSAFSSPLLLRGAPNYSINTVSELTHWSATFNCAWRTCPRSLHGSYSGILPEARHRTYARAITPHEFNII